MKTIFDPVTAVSSDDLRTVMEDIFACDVASRGSRAAEHGPLFQGLQGTSRGRRATTRVPTPKARKVRHHFLIGCQRPVDMKQDGPGLPENAQNGRATDHFETRQATASYGPARSCQDRPA